MSESLSDPHAYEAFRDGAEEAQDTDAEREDDTVDDPSTYGQTLPTIVGTLELGSPEVRERRCLELLGEGALLVRVPSPPKSMRGKLEGFLDDAVESKLASLGAAGPHPRTEDKLGDQLFRARAIGAAGLVLSVDPLAALRSPALTPEDSSTLVALAYATKNRPFVLLLDDEDRDAPAYGRPVALLALLDPRLVRTMPAPVAAPPAPPATVVEPEPETLSEPSPPSFDLAPATTVDRVDDVPRTETVPPVVASEANHALALVEATAGEADEDEAELDEEPAEHVFVPVDHEVVAAHARALAQVRGPQPLAMLKSLFLSHYVALGEILAEAKAHGAPIEPRSVTAFTTFRKNFERAYADAFPTFALTGKRPKMVLDAFEEATRLARASGARSTSLLLVPSLRADLGQRTHEALSHMLPEDALVESGLLFAALPTSSARQEDTLARGVAALGSPRPDESLPDPEWHTRGTLRRVRMGARDLFCLDTVAAFRGAPHGRSFVSELRDLSEGLAVAVARHAHGLVSGKSALTNGRSPERTLLFVFGDHGFTYTEDGVTRDGGATPEEVIVPYFAYILDPAN